MKFATWMVFCLFMAPVVFCTVGAFFVALFGGFHPEAPWWTFTLVPLAAALFWVEIVISEYVLKRLT